MNLSALLLGILPLTLAPLSQTPAPTPPADATPAKPAAKPVYDEAADAKADLAAAFARATKENRRVLIQWGANGCVWCTRLADLSRKDKEVSRKLLYEYDVVHVDIGRGDKNQDLAKKYGADLSKGVPYLTVLDAKGAVLANQQTGVLEDSGKSAHDPAKLLAFLTQHQAPYEKAEELLGAAFVEAAEAKKRVFLTFGAPWCGWCHRLEDWLATPSIAAVLSKDFVIRKIDIDRTIGGKELKARYAAKEGGIPWSCFLQADGKVLATLEAADGSNLGFPYSDDEIMAFTQSLAKSVQRISMEDIDKLQRSLVDLREADLAKKAAR